MGEIRLDHCCRLCLKEGFSLTNIFSHRSAAGDPLYQILNFIYEMKIFENDGLPSQICSPCMWRMIEFDACKRNVRSAEAEIMRLLSQTRPVSIKEEFDIVEWQMPAEVAVKVPEAARHFQDEDICNKVEPEDVEPVELPEEEYEEKCNEEVFCQPLQESAGSSHSEIYFSSEPSKGTAGNPFKEERPAEDFSFAIEDANKGITEDDVVPEEESLSAELSENIPNETELSHVKAALSKRKSGFVSRSKAPLSKRNSGFICDICKSKYKSKWNLSNHVWVHYDERQFSCNVCKKEFKSDKVRALHELKHLMDRISKSGKGSEKNQYPCGVCAKNFRTRSALLGHLNMHSNKHKCNDCGKAFKCNSELRIHAITHTQEKPFKCEVCSRCFNQKSNLNRHSLVHTSEKSFSCDTCGKRFKTKQEKTRHALFHLRKE